MQLRRCEHFSPLPHVEDQRNGKERGWTTIQLVGDDNAYKSGKERG
jgi:hypothetical protein